MSFLEIQFPAEIATGATGGPGYQTVVTQTAGGFEQRVALRSQRQLRWEISPGEKTPGEMELLSAFFDAVQGRTYGFRFKDLTDYQAINQALVTPAGSPYVMQLQKTYTFSGNSRVRKIRKPVSGSVTLRKNGSAFASSGNWTLDTTTGIVTLSAAPSGGDVFDWSGEFDVPVRFDSDLMRYVHDDYAIRSWSNVALVEILY